jgi:enoyl-CoA hydratase/carnithine racemase
MAIQVLDAKSLVKSELCHDGAVLKLTLCDPPSNALDRPMLRALTDALDAPGPRVKLVLFAAEGANFSAGRTAHESSAAALEDFRALLFRLMDLAIPTASVVRGQCHGAGLELAAFTNFVFASADATFGQQDPSGALSWPQPASLILPLKLGHGYADDLVLTDDMIDVREAFRRGLVLAWARAGESLDTLVDAWIRAHILPREAMSLRRANRAARLGFDVRLRRELPQLELLYRAA